VSWYRVPDAVRRILRCSAEPGPKPFRDPNLYCAAMGPGSAAQHCMLRSIRGNACHPPSSVASRSASAMSSMVLALKNGSSGSAGHVTVASG